MNVNFPPFAVGWSAVSVPKTSMLPVLSIVPTLICRVAPPAASSVPALMIGLLILIVSLSPVPSASIVAPNSLSRFRTLGFPRPITPKPEIVLPALFNVAPPVPLIVPPLIVTMPAPSSVRIRRWDQQRAVDLYIAGIVDRAIVDLQMAPLAASSVPALAMVLPVSSLTVPPRASIVPAALSSIRLLVVPSPIWPVPEITLPLFTSVSPLCVPSIVAPLSATEPATPPLPSSRASVKPTPASDSVFSSVTAPALSRLPIPSVEPSAVMPLRISVALASTLKMLLPI